MEGANTLLIGDKPLVWGSRTIIDNILLWCDNTSFILILFRCICEVFQKYRVYFRLDKCEFLNLRVEYVDHDILRHGNCPAQSTFILIKDWPLPMSGQALLSFIGLVNFYHRYAPYIEMRLKPLRKMVKEFYRKSIHVIAWSSEFIELFTNLKQCIASLPVLTRLEPSKLTFLKTDWSSEGMGWILMQPAGDEEPSKVEAYSLTTGNCLFELLKNGT